MNVLLLAGLAAGLYYFRDKIFARGVSEKAFSRLTPSVINVVKKVSEKTGVPANIIAAVIVVESGGNPLAVGGVGERGLMQLRPVAIQDVNQNFGTSLKFSEMFVVPLNIYAGALYLKLQHKRLGNWPDAIRAYNAGETGARRGRGKEYLKRVQKWL